MPGMDDDDLWTAYLRTQVRVELPDGGEALLAQADDGCHGDWPFPGTDHAWIITACNPRSVELTEQENRSRHEALGRQLLQLGATAFETTGFDPADSGWHEPGYVVPALPDAEADRLARAWEQNALFRWEPGRFSLVGVLMPGDAHHGWTLSRLPG
jgi:hypothetical protein